MTTGRVVVTSTRRRVLDAAAELLSRDGIDVSMEAIAERAGVTRMTVYRTLGPRDQLLVAVLLDQSAVLADGVRQTLDDESLPFPERVVEVIVMVVMAVRASRVLTFFVRGVTPSQVDALDHRNRWVNEVWSLTLPAFEAAAERGELRAEAHRTLDWTLRQILLQLVVEGTTNATERGLREELHTFFVPSISHRPR